MSGDSRPAGVHASDVLLLLAPLVLGLGSGWLLTPREYVQCGRRPRLQPPGWAFGVAWTLLYALAGVAAALAWRRAGRRWRGPRSRGLVALAAALAALMAWWVVFANRCAPAVAFAALVPAAGAVVAAAALLWADGARASAALLLPLVAWTAFASTLCFDSVVPAASR
jgi:tryptophan-rich sensory protein